MAAAVAGSFFPAARHPTQDKEPQAPQRGVTCADLRFSSVVQHCSRAWLWRQRLARRSTSTSVFNRSVRTAITATLRTSARPWVITGRDISTTAFFWAWARGAVGAIATAGAGIASAVKVAGDTTADLAALPTAAVAAVAMLAAAVVLAAADNLYMAEGRDPAQPVQEVRTVMAVDKPKAVEADRVMAVVVVVDRVMAAVADKATAVAAVDRVMAADTTKPGSLTRGA
jgi:hypothetical protein